MLVGAYVQYCQKTGRQEMIKMPHFFDPNNLTPEQQARWWAIEEYARVQEENLARTLATMKPEDEAAFLDATRKIDPNDTRSVRDHLIAMRDFSGGRAGHPKSSLFARLLNGKPALPFPPPYQLLLPVVWGRGGGRAVPCVSLQPIIVGRRAKKHHRHQSVRLACRIG
jgi:hypothetical protein